MRFREFIVKIPSEVSLKELNTKIKEMGYERAGEVNIDRPLYIFISSKDFAYFLDQKQYQNFHCIPEEIGYEEFISSPTYSSRKNNLSFKLALETHKQIPNSVMSRPGITPVFLPEGGKYLRYKNDSGEFIDFFPNLDSILAVDWEVVEEKRDPVTRKVTMYRHTYYKRTLLGRFIVQSNWTSNAWTSISNSQKLIMSETKEITITENPEEVRGFKTI